MKRKDLIKELSEKIKTFKTEKKKYKCSDSIEEFNFYIKEFSKILKVIKNGGNLEDVQNVGRWNWAAYFVRPECPLGITLKEYREMYNNSLYIIQGVEKMDLLVSEEVETGKYIPGGKYIKI